MTDMHKKRVSLRLHTEVEADYLSPSGAEVTNGSRFLSMVFTCFLGVQL